MLWAYKEKYNFKNAFNVYTICLMSVDVCVPDQ